jgi:hypothetical protein
MSIVFPGFQFLYPKSGWFEWAPWVTQWGASGGTTTQIGSDIVHDFSTPGTYQFVTKWTITMRYLVCAGGGGASIAAGGAGGFQEGTMTLGPGVYTVTVGRGGQGTGNTPYRSGQQGGDSQFFSIVSKGGGGGGRGAGGYSGGSGGSGGGGYYGGGGTPGQGNGGGHYRNTYWPYAGGGGAGSAGNGQYPGNGVYSDITGQRLYYANGGNSPWNSSGNHTVAGKGGDYAYKNGQDGRVVLRYNVVHIERAYREWIQKQYNEKLEKLKEASEAEKKALQEELDKYKSIATALDEKVKLLEQNLEKSEQELSDTKSELSMTTKEYDEKIARLNAAREAERKALEEQNEMAAQAARDIQQRLTVELNDMKAKYDDLKDVYNGVKQDLTTTEQKLEQTKIEYETKMTQLAVARKQETDALKKENEDAAAIAKAEQERLSADLASLKQKFETLSAEHAACPIIPEGTILVDGKDGQIYKYQNASLRPMSMDAYRAIGSPNYTTYPDGKLAKCQKGAPISVADITTAPATPMATSTAAPGDHPMFPGTMYVIVHGETWNTRGELKVVSSRFGGASVEPFQFKSLEQVFLINDSGYIRNLDGQGLYLTSAGDCLAPLLSKDVPSTGWRMQRSGGGALGYRLVSPCGATLKASVGAREAILEKSVFGGSASDEWYIVPVGRAEL